MSARWTKQEVDALVEYYEKYGAKRPSGVEVVREELLRAEPHHAWDGPLSASDRVDLLLSRASRFYRVFAAVSEDTAKPAPLDWSELSAKRVRAWVAVAREAGRL